MAKTFKQWIYHKTKEPKIINSDDFENHKAMGWSESPADFVLISDFGIDGNDPTQVQVLGEALAGISDRLNGELNISNMKRKDLEDYAKKHFNVEVDNFKSIKSLRLEVKGLIKG
ncbi:MAG: hypothetical protein Unbinned1520contig1002_3 [Prokaryotic dsDNA virus sp.]|nr:MAG: hypothetical protein Unbinned1520contig1002_3 [Prokaryotic dsDNA virus sp.]|tara:strand:+ start:20086 stop:20430 length:345 start_codon:yes stop_codon:yes gene_type:complete